ncbi:uncharacterized protein LOC122267206 [Penaeus japonicus]|uniref:uncharacterized protein LOC122267206 n=1 Tax=Penaeus japonicus TaxID=27405 RepID=UPI001C712B77|nr:uncharacterized protein LOC122267206 [Penaeus japonicus]
MKAAFCRLGVLVMTVMAVGVWAEPRPVEEHEGVNTGDLSLQDDIYNNLVVAVGEDQAENIDAFVPNLQRVITEASSALAKATDNLIEFRKMTILFPEHWEIPPTVLGSYEVKDVYLATAKGPHLVVADEHPVFAARAWTQHRLPCGHPGDFIFMDSTFINDTFDDRRGKKLAKEWAKYRWGVFEEHGYKDDPLYPLTREGSKEGTEELNVCLNKANWQTSTSSLLSLADYDSEWYVISKFCDSDTHVFTESRHNNLCRGKSAWEVMHNHADFVNRPNNSSTGLTINLEHLRREYIVLLVEYTENMTVVTDKGRYLQDSVIQYLLHDLAWGTKLWLMAFNSDVHLVAEVALTSDRARQSAADAFREFTSENEAGSCRDLQMAIGEAATVLYSDKSARDHGKIILITQPPSINEHSTFFCREMNAVDLGSAQSGRQVMSILYTKNINSNTTWYDIMASNPPGEVLGVNESFGGSLSLDAKMQLLDLLHELDEASTLGGLLQEVPLQKVSKFKYNFALEEALLPPFPVEGYLVIHRNADTSVQVVLSNAEGDQPLLLGQVESLDTADLFPVLFTIPGMWNFTLKSTRDYNSNLFPKVFVKTKSGFADVVEMGALSKLAEPQGPVVDEPSLARHGTVRHPSVLLRRPGRVARYLPEEEAVLMDVRVSAPLQDVALGNASDPVVMTARVTKDGKPVLGAVVEAAVTECSDGGCESKIHLFDNGSGAPDSTGGDGVYSAYWVSSKESGFPLVFTAVVTASGGENATLLEAPVEECCPSALPRGNATSMGIFEVRRVLKARVTSAGMLPPARVSDLKVTCSAFDSTSSRARIRFISPFLAERPTGQTYGIWYSNSTSVSTVVSPNVEEWWRGSVGDPIETEISMKCGSMFFFLVAGTSGLLKGEDSNLARAFCPCAPARGTSVVVIVCSVLGGVALVAAIAVAILYRQKISQMLQTLFKNESPPSEDPKLTYNNTSEIIRNIWPETEAPSASPVPPPLPPRPSQESE